MLRNDRPLGIAAASFSLATTLRGADLVGGRCNVENATVDKVWLGSTMLIGAGPLLANPVHAQIKVTLSGYAEFGILCAKPEVLVSDCGYSFFMDNRIILLAAGVNDTTGITYGANFELEVGTGGEEAPEIVTDEVALFFSGGFGRVELGEEDGAEDVMMLGGESVAAGTGGIDGSLPINLTGGNILSSGDAAKVTYFTPRIADFQVGVSYAPDVVNGRNSEDFEDIPGNGVDPAGFIGAGLNFVRESTDLYLGVAGVLSWDEEGGGSEPLSWSAGGTIGFAGLSLGGSYGHHEPTGGTKTKFITAGVGFFGLGPANVSVTYEHNDFGNAPLDDANLFVSSVDVSLMPGAILKADIGYKAGEIDFGGDSWAAVVTVQLNY